LREDGTKGKVGAVAFEDKRLVRVGDLQDRCRGEGFLQVIKRSLAFGVPFKIDIFLGELVEGPRGPREVVDEAAVEFGESDELLELGQVAGGRPVRNSLDFGGIHTQAITGNEEAKVLNFTPEKLALLRFKPKGMLAQSFKYAADCFFVVDSLLSVDHNVV